MPTTPTQADRIAAEVARVLAYHQERVAREASKIVGVSYGGLTREIQPVPSEAEVRAEVTAQIQRRDAYAASPVGQFKAAVQTMWANGSRDEQYAGANLQGYWLALEDSEQVAVCEARLAGVVGPYADACRVALAAVRPAQAKAA